MSYAEQYGLMEANGKSQYRSMISVVDTSGGNRMSEQEVKIVMDEDGRLFAVTEEGDRYILVPYERNGVFAE